MSTRGRLMVLLSVIVVGVWCFSSTLPGNIDRIKNGDVNADEKKDLADVVYLMNWLFSGGPAPEEIFCPVNPCAPAEPLSPTRIAAQPVRRSNETQEATGTALLSRNEQGITIMLETTEIPPGHAVTVWWVIFNYPEHCHEGIGRCAGFNFDLEKPEVRGDILFADGLVVPDDGVLNFGRHLELGDAPGSIIARLKGIESSGLLNPMGAEVHLIVRSHGPVIPGIEEEMINTFDGGCMDNLPRGVMPQDEGECADVQFTKFPAPAAP